MTLVVQLIDSSPQLIAFGPQLTTLVVELIDLEPQRIALSCS